MIRTFRLILAVLGLILIALNIVYPAAAQQNNDTPLVKVLTARGPVTSVMQGYIQRGLEIALSDGADLVILQLDTPGGAITIMNEIIRNIRSSEIPVVVYVAPRGAMAGSAGTLITLAGHAGAMAPETTIGAASPVGMQGEDVGDTIAAKEKELLRATVRTLAARRSPEAIALAEDTIETAKAVSAEEAYQVGLVDFIAIDVPDLLRQLDGFEVYVLDQPRILSTQFAATREIPPTLVEDALRLLTDPNIVFLLLTIGVQAILIELSNPGGWVAGFIGVVSLALVFYSFGIIPVNLFGMIFIVLAVILFVLELQTPTTGGLTVAAVASFIAGALVLFNTVRLPGFPALSIPLVIGASAILALTFVAFMTFALGALRTPIAMGKEALIGQIGTVTNAIEPHGMVQVAGELWSAESLDEQDSIPEGARVEVVNVEGLRVKVRRVH
ncbi:MAG: nodulation protein NfeD [Chloroflexota bacterium]